MWTFLWSTCSVYMPAIAGDGNMYSDFVFYRCYSCDFSGHLGLDIVICLHTLVCDLPTFSLGQTKWQTDRLTAWLTNEQM